MAELPAKRPEAEEEDPAPAAEGGEKVMGFLDHLEELRWTLVKCAIVFVVFLTLIATFLEQFNGVLLMPWDEAIRHYPQLHLQFKTRGLMEAFGVIVQICVVGALFASVPFFLFFAAQFVSPALNEKEKRVILPVCLSAFALFVAGAEFSFFFIVPKSVEIAIESNLLMGWGIEWTPESYFGFLTWMVLGLGATFQFPLVILLLTYLGIVDVATFRRSRRLVVVICVVVAAVLTPTPDPFTCLLVAAPMYLLFEISILVSVYVLKRKALAAAAAEEAYRRGEER